MEDKNKVEEFVKENLGEKDLKSITDNPDFQRMYAKMHTPWHRRADKVRRNDICPFCDSGKKFKNCECYEKYKHTPRYTINY